jgi:hypothetical protein
VDVFGLVLLVICLSFFVLPPLQAQRKTLTFPRGFAPIGASSWRLSLGSLQVGSAPKVPTTRPPGALGRPDEICFRTVRDARPPLVVTMYVWGELQTLEAATVHVLARMLYRRCPYWTEISCEDIAQRLARGLVVTVPDAEAVFLPGTFTVGDYVPSESKGWTPAEGGAGL